LLSCYLSAERAFLVLVLIYSTFERISYCSCSDPVSFLSYFYNNFEMDRIISSANLLLLFFFSFNIY